jgi:glutamine synthetase
VEPELTSIKKWISENKITEVECITPDITGVARGKIIPASKFLDDEVMRIPESIYGQTVSGEYPDEDAKVTDPTDKDMYLRPDPATIRQVPWAKDPTASVIHDAFNAAGEPIGTSPRYILRKVLALFEAKGLAPVVAPELEFYLVAPSHDPDVPLKRPVGRSGRPETGRQSYSIDAVNEFDPLFEELYDFADAQRLDIETLIHEVGAGQMEINFLHGDPLQLADQVFIFKRTVRESALRHEVYATFMAKPYAYEPGSAMHIHQSVVDKRSSRNIFVRGDGENSEAFLHYIGGLQRYLPQATALFAPFVNSYRRMTRFSTAPINVHWGYDNRTVGLRVPYSAPAARRVENRLPGADVNPYLVIATTLACGWLGMEEKIEPTAPIDSSAYDLPYQLPRNLEQALHKLYNSKALRGVLGDAFVDLFCAVKEKEHETFLKVISPWEREHLLLTV